ncbi:MAG TPA: RNA 2'-phosphotransferase [Saprospiraceae bacterium]|nr:RNA 2'-phosphotransferase [Saprospiraceae bacterium]HMU02081.1 RNA 2'-phosphotransferase [Saprospiraceae bacterium]
MISAKQEIRISKFLSLVLRHKPEIIGINLDQNGWTDVNILIKQSNDYGVNFDFEVLKHIVASNSKKRFAFTDGFDKIRASQGHSIDIELGYSNQEPPEVLYHGTSERSVESILLSGLEKRNRQHVHLSIDIETAIKVGQRHGKPQIFEVRSQQMFKDKFEFFISDNGVWLTDNVPAKYLKLNL